MNSIHKIYKIVLQLEKRVELTTKLRALWDCGGLRSHIQGHIASRASDSLTGFRRSIITKELLSIAKASRQMLDIVGGSGRKVGTLGRSSGSKDATRGSWPYY